jgi:outer membrane biosynthesis protein TonB
MTEMLFILTTVFVAYVVYTMVDQQKATPKSPLSDAEPKAKTVELAVEPEPESVAQVPATVTIETTEQAATPVKAATKSRKKTTASETGTKHQVRNPKTGEITSTTNNYRFAKRWLKEALVAEKLLDKIYKNDELNEETETKIKQALATLETKKKYKV